MSTTRLSSFAQSFLRCKSASRARLNATFAPPSSSILSLIRRPCAAASARLANDVLPHAGGATSSTISVVTRSVSPPPLSCRPSTASTASSQSLPSSFFRTCGSKSDRRRAVGGGSRICRGAVDLRKKASGVLHETTNLSHRVQMQVKCTVSYRKGMPALIAMQRSESLWSAAPSALRGRPAASPTYMALNVSCCSVNPS